MRDNLTGVIENKKLARSLAFAQHIRLAEVYQSAVVFVDNRCPDVFWRIEIHTTGARKPIRWCIVSRGKRRYNGREIIWRMVNKTHLKTLLALAYPYFVPGEDNERRTFG